MLRALAWIALITFAATAFWPGERHRPAERRIAAAPGVETTASRPAEEPSLAAVASLAPSPRIALPAPRLLVAGRFADLAPPPADPLPAAAPARAGIDGERPGALALAVPEPTVLARPAPVPRRPPPRLAAIEPGAATAAPPGDAPAPVIDGPPAWLVHAAAPPSLPQRPAIAIVIDDLGMNPRGTAEVARLPGPLTLAFLPYARDLDAQARAVRAAGHEVLVHVPMEPVGGDYPGPNALLTSLDTDEVLRRLRWGLDRIEGHVGINNHMGSLFTTDRAALAPVMAELRARGLLFLDSRTTASSVAADEALRHGVPNASRHVFLDNVVEPDAVRAQLAALERAARAQGGAIAIGHPHRVTVDALAAWLPEAQRRGFVLVPVSTLVAQHACRDGLSADACAVLAAAEPDRPTRLAGEPAAEDALHPLP